MEQVERLLSYMKTIGSNSTIQEKQTRHRLKLIESFKIIPGSKVLEIGSGQGDTTVVLADYVGDQGHVTAIDIASPEYGAPLTLKQATDYIAASEIGHRISFLFETNILDDTFNEKFDVAILSHSLFYFKSYQELSDLFEKLKTICNRICLADWDLDYKDLSQAAHAQAILLQSLFAEYNKSENNIQLTITKEIITDLLIHAGWEIEYTDVVDASTLDDGKWEVAITNDLDVKEIQELFTAYKKKMNRAVELSGINSLNSFVITASCT